MSETTSEQATASQAYRVLARKYRPQKLSELIGQETLVRVLGQAIEQRRIPHAFMLTGIRGIGKTSTARIIARSLLGKASDGTEGPTLDPAPDCEQAIAVSEGRHVDVLEVDAASRTGVNDVREIIESVRYKPVMGRYKIYIIDEVHMLSKSAFNALLKTLEEPPEHVIFIFATTEVRKIPVTILSRCMRFDLKRVDVSELAAHLVQIAKWEHSVIEESAAHLLACCAEGSVRDALSLLDQSLAMVRAGEPVTEALVQGMVGLANRDGVLKLFEQLVQGRVSEALSSTRSMYGEGADPLLILQDLLDITHAVTEYRVHKDRAQTALRFSSIQVDIIDQLATSLSMAFLSRLWQMLLRGGAELSIAYDPLAALEMLLIRVGHVSDMPTPDKLIKRLDGGVKGVTSDGGASVSPALSSPDNVRLQLVGDAERNIDYSRNIRDYKSLIELFHIKNEFLIASWLKEIRVVTFNAKQRRLEFCPTEMTPKDLAGNIARHLLDWTTDRWSVIVSNSEGGESIRVQEEVQSLQAQKCALTHVDVEMLKTYFPNSNAEVIINNNSSRLDDIPNSENESHYGKGEC